MNRWLSVVLGVLALWLAAGIGATLSLRTVGSVFAPNPVLAVLGSLGLHLSRRRGIALGAFGGFLEGALAGAHMAPYILTRALVGFGAASLGAGGAERGAPVAAAATAALSLGANLLLLFLTAPRAWGFFLLAAIVGAIVNGALAFPLGWLWGFVGGRRERTGF